MAIDTQNKRRSVQAYGAAIVYPIADAAIGAADREHVAWLYAGIPVGAPPVHRGQRNRRIGTHIGIGLSILLALMK